MISTIRYWGIAAVLMALFAILWSYLLAWAEVHPVAVRYVIAAIGGYVVGLWLLPTTARLIVFGDWLRTRLS